MRFTEAVHPDTIHLDTMSSAEIVSSLQTAELEIFGNAWGDGLFDQGFQTELKTYASAVHQAIQHPQGRFILAGAGTSGRLAFHAQLTFPQSPNKGRVVGCLAGGPEAFFKAKEGVEDSPQVGMEDLKLCAAGPGPRVFLGITCGLSAAYVAGALAQAMAMNFDAVAILGFNALEDANSRPLPGLSYHFRDLLERMIKLPQGFLLNPILGPEPLTGSTRLKGGTATKVILDVLLSQIPIEEGLDLIHRIMQAGDGLAIGLDQHIAKAGHNLHQGNGISYLSGGRAGLMALLDASECPPTFGAGPDEVKAFLGNPAMTLFRGLSLQNHAWQQFLPEGDGTFWLKETTNTVSDAFHSFIQKHGAREISHPPKAIQLLQFAPANLQPRLEDLLFKRQLNALSTGAFILAGKVWGNRMIDLRISNHKLLDRASRIIAEISRISEERARNALLRVILKDAPQDYSLSTDALIALAASKAKIVPLALIQLASESTHEQAEHLLSSYPKVREAIRSLMETS